MGILEHFIDYFYPLDSSSQHLLQNLCSIKLIVKKALVHTLNLCETGKCITGPLKLFLDTMKIAK